MDGEDYASSPQIPAGDINPLASLKVRPVTVRLAGDVWHIPALPAAGWLELLLAGEAFDPWDVFPTLAGPDCEERLFELFASGELEPARVRRLGLDVLTAVGGRPWWVTLKLCATVRAAWPTVGAALTRHGVDAARLPLAAWLDVAYLEVLERVDPKRLAMVIAELAMPPAEEEPERSEAADTDLFMATLREHQRG